MAYTRRLQLLSTAMMDVIICKTISLWRNEMSQHTFRETTPPVGHSFQLPATSSPTQ